VSSEALAIAVPAPSRRPAALSGTWLLSGAMLSSGLLAYVFHVLAARSLGPHAYGQIAILWAAIFFAAIVLFRPVEQTASRAIADRLARGEEVVSVLRAVGLVALVLLAGCLLAAALVWRPISDRVFLGDDLLTAMLVLGIVAYGLAYVVRGFVGGLRWFGGYSLGLLADALVRLLVATPLLFVASRGAAAAALVAAGLGGAVAPVIAGRRISRALRGGRSAGRFRVRTAFAFAAPASVIAAADQLLTNGAPLLVIAGNGTDGTATAGVVFAATMLVRAPVYVFQGLAASLLPNLTHLHATDDSRRFRRGVATTASLLVGGGAAIAALAAAVGPEAMALLYGSGFEAGRHELALLGIGVGCYLAATTFSQALLALDRGRNALQGWVTAACLFVGLYAVLPGDELTRISLAFFLAAVSEFVLLGLALLRRVRG
jgi:O-antigen/teichoic acid export membrane protein